LHTSSFFFFFFFFFLPGEYQNARRMEEPNGRRVVGITQIPGRGYTRILFASQREREKTAVPLSNVSFSGEWEKGEKYRDLPFCVASRAKTPVSGSRACYFVFFRESADQFGRRL
jgi:hypothetical protein